MMESSRPHATIRPCMYREMRHIISIYNHYVSNTVASLDTHVKRLIYAQNLYNSVHDQGLPFLVVTARKDDDPIPHREHILGYACAHPYRELPAYSGTVEILIYLDPTVTGERIGAKMLNVLLDMLRAEHRIEQVLAIVPVHEGGRDASRFFLREGFEDRGLLKGVAWKMGRWIDTRTFQRSLGDELEIKEKAEQEKRVPVRRWWSSLFRRRRRRAERTREEELSESAKLQIRGRVGDDSVESRRKGTNQNHSKSQTRSRGVDGTGFPRF